VEEIAPGLWHWKALWKKIGSEVSSYYLAAERVLIDPMIPPEGIGWFEEHGRPPARPDHRRPSRPSARARALERPLRPGRARCSARPAGRPTTAPPWRALTLDRYGHLLPGSLPEAATLIDAYLARTGEQTGERPANPLQKP
jgi:hypothetical protein